MNGVVELFQHCSIFVDDFSLFGCTFNKRFACKTQLLQRLLASYPHRHLSWHTHTPHPHPQPIYVCLYFRFVLYGAYLWQHPKSIIMNATVCNLGDTKQMTINRNNNKLVSFSLLVWLQFRFFGGERTKERTNEWAHVAQDNNKNRRPYDEYNKMQRHPYRYCWEKKKK